MNIAAIQLEINDNDSKATRFKTVDILLSKIQSAEKKPDLILLPETWGCGFFDFENYSKEAESLEGATFQLLSSWASKLDTFILGGSIIEADGENLFNTSILINREGNIQAKYRKMHLWGHQSKEADLLERGQSPVVVNTEFGSVGLSTCYDLRFPEQYRQMVDEGAEIFLIVSAWPDTRINHWRLFNQARALENQCWLVSCNCSGVQKGSRFGGHSMTVSPMGEILAEAGTEAYVLWSELDLAKVRECRKQLPFLADRIKGGN